MSEQNQTPEQQPEANPAKRKRVRKTVAQIREEEQIRAYDLANRTRTETFSDAFTIASSMVKPGAFASTRDGLKAIIDDRKREISISSYCEALRDLGIPQFVIESATKLGPGSAHVAVKLYLDTVKHCESQSGEKPAATPANPNEPTAGEMAMIRSNQMIEAVKAVRARTGLGLKEALDLCKAAKERMS